jgi:DNA-binding CsgD family transcriptional regulator
LAARSRLRRDLAKNHSGQPPVSAEARLGDDLLLLEGLLAHLPVGLLVNDAETLEVLHAKAPLPGFADPGPPVDLEVASRSEEHPRHVAAPELVPLLEEVAATGAPRHLSEFRHGSAGQAPRWWTIALHRIDTVSSGRVLVTLAFDLTDQVRARQLLEERERRHLALREKIAAVPGHNLVSSLQEVADCLVPALQVDVAAIRLLDADAKLHLVAASGLRPAERHRLALEPITRRRLQMIVEGARHPLVGPLGLHWIEVRWLEAGGERIGSVTIGARSERRLSADELALLDATAAELSDALRAVERSPRSLRSRSLRMARVSAEEDQVNRIRVNSLRPRERTILRLYGEGLGTDQIAELLVLSPHTVRTHVRNARERLGVSSRAEALDLLKATDTDPAI